MKNIKSNVTNLLISWFALLFIISFITMKCSKDELPEPEKVKQETGIVETERISSVTGNSIITIEDSSAGIRSPHPITDGNASIESIDISIQNTDLIQGVEFTLTYGSSIITTNLACGNVDDVTYFVTNTIGCTTRHDDYALHITATHHTFMIEFNLGCPDDPATYVELIVDGHAN